MPSRLRLERGVGAGEVDLLGDELLDAVTGTGAVVRDGGVGAVLTVGVDGFLNGVVLGGGTLGLEGLRSALARGAAAGLGGRVVGTGRLAATGAQGEGAREGDAGDAGNARDLHGRSTSRKLDSGHAPGRDGT